MFEASAVKFCKSVGENSLLPAPSIYNAERCQPFQVVVKKQRRWWSWQSPSFEPSPFTLSQLIKEEDHIKEKVNVASKNLLSYNKTHKLSVSGKLGSKIKSLLDVELDGSDSVDLEAKFGAVWKTAADQTQLMDYVAGRHLNLNHGFIKEVRDNPRRSLSVVVGSCYLKSGGTVTAKKTVKADEKLDESLTSSIATVGEEVDVNNEDSKTITLPAGTTVAYSVCELQVAGNGGMTLCIDKNIAGGFEAGDSTDGATAGDPDQGEIVAVMFKPLLELEKDEREKIRSTVLRMCSFPADIDSCLVLLKQCVKLASTGLNITKTTDVTLLGNKFLCPPEVWKPLLQSVGFQFQEGGAVDYPKGGMAGCPLGGVADFPPDGSLLSSVLYMYEALVEMSDEALIALSTINHHHAKPLIYLLTQTLSGKMLQTTDKELKAIYEGTNPEHTFVEALGFSVNQSSQILPPAGEYNELHGASRALYGLFWDEKYDHETSEWGCVLL